MLNPSLFPTRTPVLLPKFVVKQTLTIFSLVKQATIQIFHALQTYIFNTDHGQKFKSEATKIPESVRFPHVPCFSLLERNMTTVEKRGTCRMLCRMLYALSTSPVDENKVVTPLQVSKQPLTAFKKNIPSECPSRDNGHDQIMPGSREPLDILDPPLVYILLWVSVVLN